jgi:hypothetical protein
MKHIQSLSIDGAEVVEDDPKLIRYILFVGSTRQKLSLVTPRTSQLGKLLLSEIEDTPDLPTARSRSLDRYPPRVPLSLRHDLAVNKMLGDPGAIT